MRRRAFATVAVALWAFVLASPVGAQVVTGTYVGDGVAGRSFTGLGFQPELVIIKLDDTNASAVARTSTMGGSSLLWASIVFQGNLITSLDADGFTVGNQVRVNGNNICGGGGSPCVYYWTAFNADSNIVVGSYNGDGAATQSISGIGFAVDYLMIFPNANKWPRNRWSFASTTPLGSGANFRVRNAGENSTSIPSLDADGFTVGNGNSDQEDMNDNIATYHYVAFKEQAGVVNIGKYAGDGANPRSVTGVGFQPNYVIVQSLDDGDQAIQKSDQMPAADSSDFLNGVIGNRIVGLIADGFQVSDDARVNDISGEEYTYIAFSGAGAAKPVYYSVGTSGATDLKNGTPTVTITSGTATFTTPQPANVGQGDEITYNVSNRAYISSRTSAYEFTVTTARGLVPLNVAGATVNSITRAFDSLSAAQTGSSDGNHLTTANLVTEGVQLNWVCYNDNNDPMDDTVDVAGWTTGPGNYIRIYTPVAASEVGRSQRHSGIQGTGFRLAPVDATSQPYDIIFLRTGYVRIEGLEIDGAGLSDAVYARGITVLRDLSNVGDIRIDANIIHDLHTRSGAVASEGSMGIMGFHDDANEGPPMRISNNVIYDISNTLDIGHIGGIHIGARGTSYVYNNTIYKIINNPGCALAACGPSWGIYAKAFGGGSVTAVVTNNYVGDVQGKNSNVFCYDTESGGVLVQSNNVASDSSASGAMSVDNQTDYPKYFVSITADAENLHLRSDSMSLWGTTGADLSGDANLPVTDDVDRQPRHPTTPDIGADEAAVPTNFRSIGTAGPYSTGTIDTNPGSPVVQGNLTAWVSANRGRGDHITFNSEEYTILSVDSETQLTLTEPAQNLLNGVGYTISRQFSTLQAWEDCISGDGGCTFFPPASGNLVNDGRAEVGIAYNDSLVPADPDFTANLVFDGAVTDATHAITLTADAGNRHHGIPGTGVLYDCSSCLDSNDEIQIFDVDNVTIEWLEIVGVNGSAGDGGIKVRTVQNALLQYLLVHDNRNGIRLSDSPGKSLTVRNSIVYNNTDIGIEGDEPGDVLVVENATVFGNGARGINGQTSGPTTVVRNTISMNNGIDFQNVGTQENNISQDGTASCGSCLPDRDPTASASPGPPPNSGWVMFLNLNPANEDFHLRNNPALNHAQNNAQDLSGSFDRDVDLGVRVSPWDVGADDADAATAVELIAFDAVGVDGAVELSWETGAELDNLGFHLYRSTEEAGEYERITRNVIPGLGSSPAGAFYEHRDSGLVNDTTYFYKLEDIDTSGATKRHGPVSAMPRAGTETAPPTDEVPEEHKPDARSLVTFGDPSLNQFNVLSWDEDGAVVELVTEGFYAEPSADGSVVITAPGLEPLGGSDALRIPVARPWLTTLSGVGVKIVSVKRSDVERFSSLQPLDPGSFDLVATQNGVVRAQNRQRTSRRRGYVPSRRARVLDHVFRGETKLTQLELAPLRWHLKRSELQLTRRLVVRLTFTGRARDEAAGRRRYRARGGQSVIARFATTSPGLHVVHYQQIFGVGVKRVYRTAGLRLSRLGETVPFHVEPDPSSLGPRSTVYFVSAGPDVNPYGDEAVYELEGSRAGTRMASRRAAPSGDAVPFYWETLAHELDRYYQPALLSAPDRWLWDVVMSRDTKSYSIEVGALAPAHESGRVSVWLQGASELIPELDHHVRLSVNGTVLGEGTWDGKQPYRLDAELPPGVLVTGANSVTLENVGDTGADYSMVFLDRFEVDYPRTAPPLDRFEGRFTRSGTATLNGLGPRARLVDVTDASAPIWLNGAGVGATGALAFHVDADHRYLAVEPDAIANPEVRRPSRARLRDQRRGADYIVIGPKAFLTTAAPLAKHRRQQGLRVRSVAFEQIVDEFGFGESRPEAIRDFLAHTHEAWKAPAPKYVLLLGDATYDYKDAMGTGVSGQLPALTVETSFLWTASDPTLAMFAGDDVVPDVAIGRLPAKDIAELETMIGKILEFERGDASIFGQPMVLVADDTDRAGDFEADANEIASSLLSGQRVDKIFLSQRGPAGTREAVVRSFNDGAALVSYLGHGGIHLWADENVFNTGDVAMLASQSQQPLFITMNCLNGYFHFPFFDSLAETLLKSEGRGAVAAFSPTGLSLNTPAHRYHKALLDAVFRQGHSRLGDAVLAAQKSYADSGAFPELLAIYHLFGDPALRLK